MNKVNSKTIEKSPKTSINKTKKDFSKNAKKLETFTSEEEQIAGVELVESNQ